MQINSKSYMQNAEFKARQALFLFAEFSQDTLTYLVQFRKDCRTGWNAFTKRFTIKTPEQLKLDFVRSITEWANWAPEKNLVISFAPQ